MARDPGPLRLADPGTLLATTHPVGGGLIVKLRLARPSDAVRMAAFLGRLEPEVLHGPFRAALADAPAELVGHLTFYDPRRRLVVVATTVTDAGEEIAGLIGLSLPDSGVGGVAVVVDQPRRGLGVGKLLTEAAAALALRQGAAQAPRAAARGRRGRAPPDAPAGSHGADLGGRRAGGTHAPAPRRAPSRLSGASRGRAQWR